MSYNIYVKFKKNNAPTKDDIENTLKNYISSGGNITHDEVCFYVTLIGKPQYPFYHEDPMPRQYNKIKMFPQELRWFEIWIEFDKINIIKEICIKTRMQDEFTHVVANGYANICKRKWKGTKSED
jgi:hypothetical protein